MWFWLLLGHFLYAGTRDFTWNPSTCPYAVVNEADLESVIKKLDEGYGIIINKYSRKEAGMSIGYQAISFRGPQTLNLFVKILKSTEDSPEYYETELAFTRQLGGNVLPLTIGTTKVLVFQLVSISEDKPDVICPSLRTLLYSDDFRGKLKFPNYRLQLERQIVSGFKNIHEKGIIHRDASLSNVLVQPGNGVPGAVTFVDFGISTKRPKRFTPVKHLVGTPLFTSPEAFLQIVNDRVDVYAAQQLLLHLSLPPDWFKALNSKDPIPAPLARYIVQRPRDTRNFSMILEDQDFITPEKALALQSAAPQNLYQFERLKYLAENSPRGFRRYYRRIWRKAYEQADSNIKLLLIYEVVAAKKSGPKFYRTLSETMRARIRAQAFSWLGINNVSDYVVLERMFGPSLDHKEVLQAFINATK